MKKRLAILFAAILALACVLTSLSVGAATYTDVVNLLPQNADVITQNSAEQNGIVDFALTDGKLSLTRDPASAIFWPSIRYELNKEVDLSATPYLHLSFTCSAEGEDPGRGVNGHVFYTVNGGEEQDGWFSEIAGRGDEDFRGSSDVYFDFSKVANTKGKITITAVILSIYGNAGETVVWNALALASDGEGTPEPSESEPVSSEESTESENASSEAASSEAASSEESSASEGVSAPSSEAPVASTSSAASDVSSAASSAASDAQPDDNGGMSPIVIALIAVLCAAVVAAVVVVIVKKKK